MDQPKQPTPLETKTAPGVQPTPSEQQKVNIPQVQGQDHKPVNPVSGNQAPQIPNQNAKGNA